VTIFDGTPETAIPEINTLAAAWSLPPALMDAVAVQEGHLYHEEVPQTDPGNGRLDFGPFNMNAASYPYLATLATRDPLSAADPAKAFAGRGTIWQRAFADAGGAAAWQADPVSFFSRFMPAAQGSVAVPPQSAAGDVQEGTALASGVAPATVLGGAPLADNQGFQSTGSGGGGAAVSPDGFSIPNPLSALNPASWVKALASPAETVGIFILGVVVVLGGLLVLGHGGSTVQTAARAAAA
jgi:hypothetical protein